MHSLQSYFETFIKVSDFISRNNRNEKCWCDSGKKFKNCHLNREKSIPLTIQEEQEKLKKIDTSFKLCLFNKFDNNCSNGIIKAHSVSKELFLRKISKNNNVYSPIINTIKHNIIIKEVHVNNASIFYGFCNTHDTSLFSDFEQKKFTSTDCQLLKISYRSLCLEIFKKMKVIEKYYFYKNNSDKGKELSKQIDIQIQCNQDIIFNKNSLNTLEKIQTQLEDDVINNTSHKMKHCLITLDKPQNILCSSMVSPEFNLDRKRLQSLKATPNAKNLFLNSFIFNNTGYILISWLIEDDDYGNNFSNSIFSDPTLINHKLISLILMYTENVFISPSWWDDLTDEDKHHFQCLIEYIEDKDQGGILNIKDHPEALNYSYHVFI